MKTIRFLPLAWEDLDQIQGWYLLQMGPDTARKVRDNILDHIAKLADYPYLGVRTPDEWLNELGYKILVVKRHVVFYREIDADIVIYYIADSRTDYLKHFYISGRVLQEQSDLEYDSMAEQ